MGDALDSRGARKTANPRKARHKAPHIAGIVLSALAAMYFADHVVHTGTVSDEPALNPQTTENNKAAKSVDISPVAAFGALASITGIALFANGLRGAPPQVAAIEQVVSYILDLGHRMKQAGTAASLHVFAGSEAGNGVHAPIQNTDEALAASLVRLRAGENPTLMVELDTGGLGNRHVMLDIKFTPKAVELNPWTASRRTTGSFGYDRLDGLKAAIKEQICIDRAILPEDALKVRSIAITEAPKLSS